MPMLCFDYTRNSTQITEKGDKQKRKKDIYSQWNCFEIRSTDI